MLIPEDDKVQPPPPFSELDGAVPSSEENDYPPEKVQTRLSDESEDVPVASTSKLNEEGSRSITGPAISYHIYRVPENGMFDQKLDVVIKNENKDFVEYYLEDPRQILSMSKCDMTLRRHSETGPIVAKMVNGGRFSLTCEIRLVEEEFTTTLSITKSGQKHTASGKKGENLKWSNQSSRPIGDWVCTNEDNGDIVARWRRTVLARVKEGQLMIMPNYADQVDLILATSLAVEGWARRERGG